MSDSYTISTCNGRATIRRGKYEHTYTIQQLRANALSDADPAWNEAMRALKMVDGKEAQPVEAAPTQIGLFE